MCMGRIASLCIAQIPLHTFPRNFPVDGEATNLLRICYWRTGVMDFGHYATSLLEKQQNLGGFAPVSCCVGVYTMHADCGGRPSDASTRVITEFAQAVHFLTYNAGIYKYNIVV